MEEENVVSYFHGAAAMADKDLCVSNKEELVSDDPDVYLGDEPSLEVGEDANIEGSGDNGFKEFAADKEAHERKREPKPETRYGCLAHVLFHTLRVFTTTRCLTKHLHLCFLGIGR
ncbi:hypothetical protein S245_017931 [Arachis hypogaea]